jgi:hypothetical protein
LLQQQQQLPAAWVAAAAAAAVGLQGCGSLVSSSSGGSCSTDMELQRRQFSQGAGLL